MFALLMIEADQREGRKTRAPAGRPRALTMQGSIVTNSAAMTLSSSRILLASSDAAQRAKARERGPTVTASLCWNLDMRVQHQGGEDAYGGRLRENSACLSGRHEYPGDRPAVSSLAAEDPRGFEGSRAAWLHANQVAGGSEVGAVRRADRRDPPGG